MFCVFCVLYFCHFCWPASLAIISCSNLCRKLNPVSLSITKSTSAFESTRKCSRTFCCALLFTSCGTLTGIVEVLPAEVALGTPADGPRPPPRPRGPDEAGPLAPRPHPLPRAMVEKRGCRHTRASETKLNFAKNGFRFFDHLDVHALYARVLTTCKHCACALLAHSLAHPCSLRQKLHTTYVEAGVQMQPVNLLSAAGKISDRKC